MFCRCVHLGGWQYDVEPQTGGTYSTTPEGQWMRTEAPRLVGPFFAPPDPHIMRDPTLASTWETGAPIIDARGMRPMLPPWRTPSPGG